MKIKNPIVKYILFPPFRSVTALCFTGAVMLAVIFSAGLEDSPFAYFAYILSFYALTVLCLACCKGFPNIYNKAQTALRKNKYSSLYLTDAHFKVEINLYRSLIINLIYAAVKLMSAVIYKTYWFAIFAVYYTIMAIMRYLLVRYINRKGIDSDKIGELSRARLCLLILMNITIILSGAVLMMIEFGRGFNYPGILIYVMAAYCFYITTCAVLDLAKNKGSRSPILSAAAVIRLTSALVSMLALETAMFAQFADSSSYEFQQLMIILTGAAICAVIVGISVCLIVRYTNELKKLRTELN